LLPYTTLFRSQNASYLTTEPFGKTPIFADLVVAPQRKMIPSLTVIVNFPSSLNHLTPKSSVHESYLALFWLGAGVGLGVSVCGFVPGLANLSQAFASRYQIERSISPPVYCQPAIEPKAPLDTDILGTVQEFQFMDAYLATQTAQSFAQLATCHKADSET